MPKVNLTYRQVVNAARQLPEPQRLELIDELQQLPNREEARAIVDRLRDKFAMTAHQQKRLSELLARGNEGMLTSAERKELNRLEKEYKLRSLDMAKAVAGELSCGRANAAKSASAIAGELTWRASASRRDD